MKEVLAGEMVMSTVLVTRWSCLLCLSEIMSRSSGTISSPAPLLNAPAFFSVTFSVLMVDRALFHMPYLDYLEGLVFPVHKLSVMSVFLRDVLINSGPKPQSWAL